MKITTKNRKLKLNTVPIALSINDNPRQRRQKLDDKFASIRISQVVKDYRSTEIVFNRISRQLEL